MKIHKDYTRHLYFSLGLVLIIFYMLSFLYAIKFFIYAIDPKTHSYYLYSKLEDKNAEELRQLVHNYPIIIYRINLTTLIGFLSICAITLISFKRKIIAAIGAIVVAGFLTYFDLLKVQRPKFSVILPSDWFRDLKTFLMVNGLTFLTLSLCLYLLAHRSIAKIGRSQFKDVVPDEQPREFKNASQ